MTLSPKSLAGPGYIILNALRALNIISFLAVIAASVVMLIKTSTSSHFFFFDAVTHVITTVSAMFLLISELSLCRGYFARNWPLLSPSHGFVALAIAMIVLGVNILGDLNETVNSQKNLGLALWRIVIAAGILVFILGFFNLFASYIFRDRHQGITARQVRAKGAVAIHRTQMSSSITSASTVQSSPSVKSISKSFVHTRAVSEDESTLPSYNAPKDPMDSPTSKYSRGTCDTRSRIFGWRRRESLAPPLPINISAPMNFNHQFDHLVKRPDSTLHPSRTGETETQRHNG